MIKKFILSILTGACLISGDSGLKSSGNVKFLSEYIYRGENLSNSNPALQGGIQLVYLPIYIGITGSSVYHENPIYSSEYSMYSGMIFAISSVGINIGYMYVNHPDAISQDFEEVYIGVVKAYGAFSIKLMPYFYSDFSKLKDISLKFKYGFEYFDVGMQLGSYIDNVDYSSLFVIAHFKGIAFKADYKASFKQNSIHTLNNDRVIGSIEMSF